MGRLHAEEMVLNMGPQHPSTHGVLRLKLRTDGEIVSHIEPVIGYLHRSFEKHAENLEYQMITPFTGRCDYLAAIGSEHGYAMAVEKMMGIELPERVEYLRVIFAEFQRIASHLVAVGTFGLDVGAITPFIYCFRERELILDLFEMASGARLLYNYIWIGGLAHDVPPGFVEKAYEFLDAFDERVAEYNQILTGNKIFIEKMARRKIKVLKTSEKDPLQAILLFINGEKLPRPEPRPKPEVKSQSLYKKKQKPKK